MNASEALTIFENIESPDYEDGQKGMAVKTVLEMATHNSVSKSAMVKVIRWMLPLCFVVHNDSGNKDAEGVCPVCGGKLWYTGRHQLDDSGGTYWWVCPHCGASGEEGYNRAFDRHYNVADKDGNPIPGRPE